MSAVGDVVWIKGKPAIVVGIGVDGENRPDGTTFVAELGAAKLIDAPDDQKGAGFGSSHDEGFGPDSSIRKPAASSSSSSSSSSGKSSSGKSTSRKTSSRARSSRAKTPAGSSSSGTTG